MHRGVIQSATLLAALIVSLAPSTGIAADGEEGSLGIHGYGEVHYNNPELGTMSSDAVNGLDFHRFVLGWEYEFNEKLRLDGEIDFEHAATEIELEYAFIEYDLAPTVALRVGSLLMPVGPLNEFHEPPLFYSVERPYVQRYIIPTTWQENGLGVAGQAGAGRVSYRAYLTAGLDAANLEPLQGLRHASSKGAESKADDLAGVARLEYGPAPGFLLGASGYFGGADQSTAGLGDVTVGVYTADARYHRGGLDLRGVFVRTALDGADSVSALVGGTIGEAMRGWYAEAAYDLLRRAANPDSRRALVVFGRYESFDTNEEAPAGFARDPAGERTVATGGIAYYPIEKVAFKADLEHWEDGADQTVDRFNLGAAFMF